MQRPVIVLLLFLFCFNSANASDSLLVNSLIRQGNQLLFDGQTEAASIILKEAYNKSTQSNSKKLIAKSAFAYSQYLINSGKLPLAIEFLKVSATSALDTHDSLNFLRNYIQLSRCFRFQGNLDSSVAYLEFPLNYIGLLNSYTDSIDIYLELGLTQYKTSCFSDAIGSALIALSIAEAHSDSSYLAKTYLALTDIYVNKVDREKELQTIESLMKLKKFLSIKEKVRFLELCAAHAEVSGAALAGRPIFMQAISMAKKASLTNDLCHLYTSLGSNFRIDKNKDSAFYYLGKANRMAYESGNISNLIHNLERYLWVYSRVGNINAQLDTAFKLFEICKNNNDFLTAYDAAYAISENYAIRNKPILSYEWLKKGRKYFIKAYDSKNANSESLYQAILKSKQKEKLLVLKDKELAEKKLMNIRLITYLSVVLILIILLPLVIYLALKNRHQKTLLVQKKEIRENISADLHDIVGTDISAISRKSDPDSAAMNELDLKSRLSDIHTKSNKIYSEIKSVIWALNPENEDVNSLLSKLRETALEMFDGTNVCIELNIPENSIETKLSPGVNRNIYLIFKEALNNILKHSGANFVVVNCVFKKDHRFVLTIQDNGIGFSPDGVASNANGIRNMRNRAKKLNGSIQIKECNNGGSQLVVEGKLK